MKIAKLLSGIVALVAGIIALVIYRKDGEEFVVSELVLHVAFVFSLILSIALQKPCKLNINKGFRIAALAIGAVILLIAVVAKKRIYEVILMCDMFYVIPVAILPLTEVKKKENGLGKLFAILISIYLFVECIFIFIDIFGDIDFVDKALRPSFLGLFGFIALKGLIDIIMSFIKGKAKEEPVIEAASAEQKPEEQPEEAPAEKPAE